MKRIILFALLALMCAGGAFAQTPSGAYSSPAQGGGSAFGPIPATPAGVTYTACAPAGGTGTYCWPGITVTSQTGASYTVAATDRSTVVTRTNAGAITDTIPDVGGTNFQFGFPVSLTNIGSTIDTISRTSASTINGGTSWTLHSNYWAFFYSDPANNWRVFSAVPVESTGMGLFSGNSAITSAPPSGTEGNLGWKFCLYQALFCTGIAGSTEYHRLNTQNWLSIGAGNANNDSTGTGTDTAATTSMSSFGGLDFKENACSTNFVPAASHSIFCPDATAHEILVNVNGDSMASHQGMMTRRMPVPINSPGLTALVANGTTLCAASAGACNVAGQYDIHINVWGSGTACGTPSPGGVTPNLSWTDENGVAHANVVIPMMSQTGAASTAVNVSAPTVAFQSALANEGGSGDFTLSTNGTVIQYGVAYAACGVGTGTYGIRISVTKLQSP